MTADDETRVIAFEANGARASVRFSPPELLGAVVTHTFPLGWSPCRPLDADPTFGLALEGDGVYAVVVDHEVVFREAVLDSALATLRSYVLAHALEHARERLFIHAGCVGHHGAAILLPGRRNAGKTTLVAALVRAGAVYYTDDYAPLDADGLAHPYPLALWMSDLGGPRTAESLGGTVGEEPLPVAVVARIAFMDGRRWEVRRQGPSQGALLLLQNSLGHERQPEFALKATRRAVDGAVVLDGERGNADEAAEELLELAERTLAR